MMMTDDERIRLLIDTRENRHAAADVIRGVFSLFGFSDVQTLSDEEIAAGCQRFAEVLRASGLSVEEAAKAFTLKT